jgi:hypothetical protein
VSCSTIFGAYKCPMFSSCGTLGGCNCNSGYMAVTCGGTACTAQTCSNSSMNWWCIP